MSCPREDERVVLQGLPAIRWLQLLEGAVGSTFMNSKGLGILYPLGVDSIKFLHQV